MILTSFISRTSAYLLLACLTLPLLPGCGKGTGLAVIEQPVPREPVVFTSQMCQAFDLDGKVWTIHSEQPAFWKVTMEVKEDDRINRYSLQVNQISATAEVRLATVNASAADRRPHVSARLICSLSVNDVEEHQAITIAQGQALRSKIINASKTGFEASLYFVQGYHAEKKDNTLISVKIEKSTVPFHS